MDQVGSAHPSFELLSAYSDREATVAEAAGVEAHLDTCSACRATVQGFTSLNSALAAPPAVACTTAIPLISAQLDREASPPEAAIAAVHLAGCAACQERRADWRALDSLIAGLPAGVPSPAVDARIRALTRRAPRRLPIPAIPVPAFVFGGGPIGGVGVLARVAVIAAVMAMAVLSGSGVMPSGPAGPSGSTALSQPNLVASIQTVVINPRTNTLYSLEPALAVVFARNASTTAEIARISVGGRPTALALSEERNAVYVLDPTAKTVTEIDGLTNTVAATVALPVQGDPTSIQVNQQSGQVVIASRAAPGATPATTGALSIIEPGSKKVETVRQVDVAPSLVVVDPASSRVFVVGASSTSVLDAATYQPVATIPTSAVAVAVSAKGGPALVVSQKNGKGHLSLYGGAPAEVDLASAAVSAVSLPDGSFAVLVEAGLGARIQLVAADGSLRGSLEVNTAAKQLAFDAETAKFVSSSGATVATLSGGLLAAATPPPPTTTPRPTPSATASPSPSPSASPSASGSPSPSASAPVPSSGGPSPTPAPPVPGAQLAAAGLYRIDLGERRVVAMTRVGPRIWFVDQLGGVNAIDTSTGQVSSPGGVENAVSVAFIAGNDVSVFVVEPSRRRLSIIDVATGKVSRVAVPFGQNVVGAAAASNGHLWLAAQGNPGLLDYEPSSKTFSLVSLPAGSNPSAIASDASGRVWYADGGRSVIGSYEPSLRHLTEFRAPSEDPVTFIDIDPDGVAWFATAGGEVFTVSPGGLLSASKRVASSIVDLASGPAGTWYITADVPVKVAKVGQAVRSGPGTATTMAVDGAGHVWLAAPTYNAFFVLVDTK